METNKTIDLMNYVEFPKRYTEAKGKLVAQPITTINSARRVENEDMTVCYILDQDDDVMDFIFDRDIITVYCPENGTATDEYFCEIIFNSDDTFTLKRLSNYVTIKDRSYPMSKINDVNITGKVVRLFRDFK
ncbi:Uncharacterised protein [Staphylococcus aureus]|uniref:Uncharacterized protein n=14 Tax=root TaxID=1 RepID=A0A2K9VBV5_9CAUD|nr:MULTISPECIES: hypothetical protein [Staphylococcus]NP_075466.1 hypothetical protein phiSLTp03 [Staphylococcus phage phiSLT]YP_007392367.1 hypothetical protein H389_gp30 [Staphylococcus phage phi7401PVL]YP_010083139.1 hypothetical protein KMD27_gp28 [Staphylococcus phage SH-St 15644]YP_010083249.1 hypothetical protein KMD29_gp06 [Staphylococcus phage vB_SauS_JS02]YP_010083564.1 hypothetical protein KMD34_gp03 [Staphylococcus phage phiSa2wa_st1]AUM57949.1 hypothetical protein [Staphylococcus